MGKRGKKPAQRNPVSCAGCGAFFIVPLKGNLKKKFCTHECYAKKQEERNGGHLKRKCAACHAAMGMTGAASGRLLNLPKSSIARIRKEGGLRRLDNSEAQFKRRPQNRKEHPWWGDKNDEVLWLSEYNPKFPDWSPVWATEKQRRRYHEMNDDDKAKHNRAMWIKRKHLYATDEEYRAKRIEYTKEWKAKNHNKVRESTRLSIKKRKMIDPGFRVQCNLRHRLKEIMGKVKKGGTEHRNNLTGCSTRQLAKHLESQFKRGMTWENYGTNWHVDHILPCASFDHNDPKQRMQCWHWTNLRPLDAKRNLDKRDNITEPQMSLLLCATH
jgi:hypothetical protein